MKVTDIDLIPANILIHEGKKWIIDYEWSYDFPIPVRFVLYRIIFYFANEQRQSRGIDACELYERYGIDEALKTTFSQMEHHFQLYIEGAHIPVRNMYPDISPGVWSFETMLNAYRQEYAGGSMENLQVYLAEDGQFTEAQSYLKPLADRHYSGVIELGEAENSLRLDPCARPCMVTLNRFTTEKDSDAVMHVDSNGRSFDGIHFVFSTYDPMFVVTGLSAQDKKIYVDFDVEAVYESTAALYISDVDEQNRLKAEQEIEKEQLRSIIRDKNDEIQKLKDEIAEMRATKVWRAYQKYSVARHKLSF